MGQLTGHSLVVRQDAPSKAEVDEARRHDGEGRESEGELSLISSHAIASRDWSPRSQSRECEVLRRALRLELAARLRLKTETGRR